MVDILALVLCIAGALVYALASNGKAAELGRILFGVALLVLLLHVEIAPLQLRWRA